MVHSQGVKGTYIKTYIFQVGYLEACGNFPMRDRIDTLFCFDAPLKINKQ